MKVLITYASAGAGHRKAAEALFDYLKETRPGLDLKIIDILDYCSPLCRFFYSKVYIFVIRNLPLVWYFFYLLSFINPNNGLRLLIDYLNCQKLVNFLEEEEWDVILSTHFLTSSVLSVLKRTNPKYKIKLVTAITDYNLHPYWIGEGVDTYIASCDKVRDELAKRDVGLDKIKVCGIPANKKFYLPVERNTAAGKLNVDPGKFTVLIITGAIGIGPIEQIVKTFDTNIQLLVVCGNNKILYERLKSFNLQNVKPYPLVDNVDELMSVSDLVLTKAGGLTITESLIKKLPMVFFSSIPGLETSNAKVICDYGAGFDTKTVKDINNIVFFLKSNSASYQKAIDNISLLRKSNTLQDISNEISLA